MHNQASKVCNYEIVKEDCINHLAKRKYKGLDNVKKSNKAKLNRKLTKENIEYISNMYAFNWKAAAPDVVKMKKSVMAMFFHMMFFFLALNIQNLSGTPPGDSFGRQLIAARTKLLRLRLCF